MNDRFKFRAGITLSYFDEEDNEKEISFEIEPDGIFNDDEIGVLRDRVIEILETFDFSEQEWYSLTDRLDDYEQSDNWLVLYPDYIKQCTGIKDKNGKLIYEGDVVREISKKEPKYEEYITTVKWNYCGFNLYRDDDFDFEVITNIDEYKDFIGEEND